MNISDRNYNEALCDCCGSLAELELEEGGEWHTLCAACEVVTRKEV
jgi:hypothetical protein